METCSASASLSLSLSLSHTHAHTHHHPHPSLLHLSSLPAWYLLQCMWILLPRIDSALFSLSSFSVPGEGKASTAAVTHQRFPHRFRPYHARMPSYDLSPDKLMNKLPFHIWLQSNFSTETDHTDLKMNSHKALSLAIKWDLGQHHLWCKLLKIISIIGINKELHRAAAPPLKHIPVWGNEKGLE